MIRLPALRDPDVSFEDRVAYLNYLWMTRKPQLIDPTRTIRVIFGLILLGTDRYTQKTTARILYPWRGTPFGPMQTMKTVGRRKK